MEGIMDDLHQPKLSPEAACVVSLLGRCTDSDEEELLDAVELAMDCCEYTFEFDRERVRNEVLDHIDPLI